MKTTRKKEVRFGVKHQPDKMDRQSWAELEKHQDRRQGERLVHVMDIGDSDFDEVVPHSLGRIPEEVTILKCTPVDGRTNFRAWEIEGKRTAKTITIETDAIHSGDSVEIRVR